MNPDTDLQGVTVKATIGNGVEIRRIGEQCYLVVLRTEEKHPYPLGYFSYDEQGVYLYGEDLSEDPFLSVEGLPNLGEETYHFQVLSGTRYDFRIIVMPTNYWLD